VKFIREFYPSAHLQLVRHQKQQQSRLFGSYAEPVGMFCRRQRVRQQTIEQGPPCLAGHAGRGSTNFTTISAQVFLTWQAIPRYRLD
jgi:hypothetical protein